MGLDCYLLPPPKWLLPPLFPLLKDPLPPLFPPKELLGAEGLLMVDDERGVKVLLGLEGTLTWLLRLKLLLL